MAEKKKGLIDTIFGGLLGNAEKEVKGRKTRLQQAEDAATGATNAPEMSGDTAAANGETRPQPSKKWTE